MSSPIPVTRIRADSPMSWEDLDTIRFGFDRAEVRVTRPGPSTQRFLTSLRIGVHDVDMQREARRAGVTPEEAAALVKKLRPVLQSGEARLQRMSPEKRLQIIICDDGREVSGLREALLATGLCNLGHEGRASRHDHAHALSLVMLVERFLEPLERAQRWLLIERPHLPIRFSDQSITVGPLIGPAGNPCHTCSTLRLLDQDAALPLLASQLYGQTPAGETEAGTHMAAAWATVLIRKWLTRDPTAHTTQFKIPMSRGLVAGIVSSHRVVAHPKCACSDITAITPPPQ